MAITFDNSGSFPIFMPEGQINSANAASFEADLLSLINRGEHRIVLDMSHLHYISSAGLRVLLLVAKKLKQCGGALVLFGLQDRVSETLEISGFMAILNVYQTRDQALAGLA